VSWSAPSELRNAKIDPQSGRSEPPGLSRRSSLGVTGYTGACKSVGRASGITSLFRSRRRTRAEGGDKPRRSLGCLWRDACPVPLDGPLPALDRGFPSQGMIRSMGTDRALALFITWTTYGTWLPGDPRGYVSGTLRPNGLWTPKINSPGQPYTTDHPPTLRRAQLRQKQPSVWLTPRQAQCVAQALLAACDARTWRMVRAAVMANHVHVVVADCPDDGPGVRRVLKGVTQAALGRAEARRRRWWTQGGSNRYLHGSSSVEAAVAYVAQQRHILAEVVNGTIVPRDAAT